MKLLFPGALAACLHGGLALCVLALVGCRSVTDPNIAPATGMAAGAGVGALIGSASGSAGTGAVIGSLIGRAGGSIVQYHKGSPALARSVSPADVPAILDAAQRFDRQIAKDYQALSKTRSQGSLYEREIAKNQARSVVAESDAWIAMLQHCERISSDAVSQETARPTGNLGHWLKNRQSARATLLSLQMHQSWFKSLTV